MVVSGLLVLPREMRANRRLTERESFFPCFLYPGASLSLSLSLSLCVCESVCGGVWWCVEACGGGVVGFGGGVVVCGGV